jgi:H+/Na+-translocating ferredoxin:NAD+ oxidoreductase subunit D
VTNDSLKNKIASKKEDSYIITTSPHIHSVDSIPRVMYSVVIALVPAMIISILFFGKAAILIYTLSIVSCLVFEAVAQKIMGRPITITDGSVLITGVLLAMNLPPSSPWWLVVLGAMIAVVLGKQIYGGLGYNPFNPVLVARIVLLISFPVQMTSWVKPAPLFMGADLVTVATPLGEIKTELMLKGVIDISRYNYLDFTTGFMGGSMGEMSVIALLLGAAFLLYRKYITWHIPMSFVGTVIILTGIFWLVDPTKYANPLFHLLAGGLILGAFFMATDMVTSPVYRKGMIIFGIGCGLITVVIRLFGGYPEGVAFSILLMNSATPIIDRYTKPKKFGYIKIDGGSDS